MHVEELEPDVRVPTVVVPLPASGQERFLLQHRIQRQFEIGTDIGRQAVRSLWAHKLRSLLTMFGIAWGVASLLLLVGMGEGFRSRNQRELDELGRNLMPSWEAWGW